MSYAGVVWAPLYATKTSKDNFFTICNNSPIEKLNIKLCKYILGVPKSSTNDAVRGELGRCLEQAGWLQGISIVFNTARINVTAKIIFSEQQSRNV